MRTNAAGINLIKTFEGCKLRAYQDGTGKFTVGWGHTTSAKEGTKITQDEANALLAKDLEFFETAITSLLPGIQLTSNQFSALVSFCFNVGLGYKGRKSGFQVLKSGKPSTMITLLRAGDFAAAAEEFEKWDKIGGVQSRGILRRRLAEKELFLTPEVKNGTT